MDIIRFLNEPKQTFFAPEWNWVMAEDQLHGIDFNSVAKLVLSKEQEIIQSTLPSNKHSPDGNTGLGPNSLTSRYQHFNVLSWDHAEIKKLKDGILEKYKLFLNIVGAPRRKVWIQCWANVLREGQDIKLHLHTVSPFCYLGGHVTIQCDSTNTVYINPINQISQPLEYISNNIVGKFTIFQNNIPHYTTVHNGINERITVAFDVIVDEEYQQLSHKSNYILLDQN